MQKPKDNFHCFNLAQWLEHLEQRYVQEIQMGLTRVRAVAEILGLLEPQAKVITVAGTNGKGSTVAALEAIYYAAGYRVGSYTSPHLLKFNERIRINRQAISEEKLCTAFSLIEKSRDKIPLTYFEVVTLAALWYYKEQNVDVILLEVGLGGRLDATNIIDADLTIITTIDFDHQAWLGNTLDAIGYEKAGILRPGKPCIYADLAPPASILSEIAKHQSPAWFLERDYQITEAESHVIIEFAGQKKQLPKPAIQFKAAAAAIVAATCLQVELPLGPDAEIQAMRNVYLPGRLDLHAGEVSILYDVSHNPQAAALLADYLKTHACAGQVHAVFSALLDKDIRGLISPLRDCVDRWYPAQLNNKRAAPQATLTAAFHDADLGFTEIYPDPWTAFLKAKAEARPQDLIIVYGSFFTVAAIMEKEIQ